MWTLRNPEWRPNWLRRPGCHFARNGPTFLNEIVFVGLDGTFFVFLSKVLIVSSQAGGDLS